MSTTYTANAKLAQPALGDTGWSTPLNGNADTLDGLTPIGGLCVTLTEIPSAESERQGRGRRLRSARRALGLMPGRLSQAITASTTKVLYLDLTGIPGP